MSNKDFYQIIPNAPYVARLMPNHPPGVTVGYNGSSTGFNKHKYGTMYHYVDSQIIANLLGVTMTKEDMLKKLAEYIKGAPTYGKRNGNHAEHSAMRTFNALYKEGLLIKI